MANTPRPLSPKQVERLNAKSTGTAIKWMSRVQTWIFKKTGGRIGDKFLRGAEVGILTTIGRKSGEERDSPLLFLQEGKRIVSRRRAVTTNPMWYRNLVANPRVKFQTQRETLELVARDATDAERDVYWPKLDAMYADFANYRSYTDRKIPIVICDPA
ncbi:nitroreductase/quinone reductase family protein [Mycobacteroides abscessus subsp. abscessus]|nr:nitroreductase/quinone reductase family protein [Mycobacteroides abscessus subsp. abscessus]